MLLAFSVILIVLAVSDFLYLGLIKVYPGADEIMWRFGVSLGKYLLIGAVISLGFFLFTMYKNNPQVQFVVEIILCLIFFFLY